jgi:hypothetical protein
MALGVPAGPVVVPGESVVDVRGAPDVVAIGIAVASQDVDESRADATPGLFSWHAARQRKFSEMARESTSAGAKVRS